MSKIEPNMRFIFIFLSCLTSKDIADILTNIICDSVQRVRETAGGSEQLEPDFVSCSIPPLPTFNISLDLHISNSKRMFRKTHFVLHILPKSQALLSYLTLQMPFRCSAQFTFLHIYELSENISSHVHKELTFCAQHKPFQRGVKEKWNIQKPSCTMFSVTRRSRSHVSDWVTLDWCDPGEWWYPLKTWLMLLLQLRIQSWYLARPVRPAVV